MTDLRRRLARLEGIGAALDATRDGAVVILPAGLAIDDADAFIAEHGLSARWDGPVVVLPDNGRDPRKCVARWPSQYGVGLRLALAR